jgi:hypothetical protein
MLECNLGHLPSLAHMAAALSANSNQPL